MSSRDETLQTVEDCGAAEMPIDETCAIVEMTETDFAADKEAVLRYRIGHLKTKLAVRQSVARLAKEGVPTMVKIYLDFNKDSDAALPIDPGKVDTAGEFDEI